MLLAVTSIAKYYKKHFWCQRINKKESNGVKVTHSWADIGFNEHNLGQKNYLAAEQVSAISLWMSWRAHYESNYIDNIAKIET